MTQPKAARWPVLEQLGFRLAFLLAVALLPLALISAVQSTAVLRESEGRSEAALMGKTLAIIEPELRLLHSARGSAASLAEAVKPLSSDAPACSKMMRDFKQKSNVYAFAGFFDTAGQMTCSSNGKPFSFISTPNFQKLMADPVPQVNISLKGPISGVSVVTVSHPVHDDAERLMGFVSISIPQAALAAEMGDVKHSGLLSLITFDETGEIITATQGLEQAPAWLPANRPLATFVKSPASSFTAFAHDGTRRVFSVVPLIPGKLYALGIWPVGVTYALSLNSVTPILIPLVMWLASLVVAWIAAEWLVIRHIRALRASITSFAKGNRLVASRDFTNAPREIREVAESFELMTETILHDEAELEDIVHQKEVLLREVHHRVKNNLQLIASIMNMQIRQAKSSEAKMLMKGLQDRVMSLATIHRELYQTSGLTDIRADELLPDIVRQIIHLATGPGRRFEVQTDFDDMRLTPDQAVPLSLLLTEALTNAMKYASGMDGAAPALLVSLKRGADDAAVLVVANSLNPATNGENWSDVDAEAGTGLGFKLLTAFAMQLGATIKQATEGGMYRLSITFDVRPLTEAEARHLAHEKMVKGDPAPEQLPSITDLAS